MTFISAEILKILYEHGVDCYPKEACGFISLNGNITKALNIQDELNKKDPNIYPRNAENGYTMSFKDLKALDASFKTCDPAICIYHSHPDVGAYFSQEDIDKALFMEEPIYNVDYLVLDIRNGHAQNAKQFSFTDKQFVCIATYDLDGNIIKNQ